MITKRSITFAGRKTSVSIEDDFWEGLRQIAHGHHKTMTELIAAINEYRQGNLSSAIRMFVLRYYREQHDQQGRTVADLSFQKEEATTLGHSG
jgi:predicted DNA-binding ribbon-helix-helix protein